MNQIIQVLFLIVILIIIVKIFSWYFSASVVKQVIFWYVLGMIISELHVIIWFFWPETEKIKYSLWFDKTYKHTQNVLWYMFEMSGILENMIRLYCVAKIAVGFSKDIIDSKELFWVAIIFMCREGIRLLLYFYNRNTSGYNSLILSIFIFIGIIYLLIPEKPTSKVRNINDY